jgi:hypothetical protein
MRLRHIVQSCAALALAVAAAPVLAHDHPMPAGEPGVAPPGPDMRPEWRGDGPPPPPQQTMAPDAREAWLGECRRRISVRDNGLGGAVIGGLIGGFAGNRIAGRGNRTVGTIAGAAVGAVAGAAIDKAEDKGRVRDECEAYLDSYYDYYAHAGRGYGYGYGYAAYGGCGGCGMPMMMVPVQRKEPECTETVEYVTEYVPAPRPRVRYVPTKRVKVVPDKRIKVK